MDKNINECNCFTAGELASLFRHQQANTTIL